MKYLKAGWKTFKVKGNVKSQSFDVSWKRARNIYADIALSSVHFADPRGVGPEFDIDAGIKSVKLKGGRRKVNQPAALGFGCTKVTFAVLVRAPGTGQSVVAKVKYSVFEL